MIDHLMRVLTTYPNDRIVGHYVFVNPVYIVRDVEMMKLITIKDFEHFVNRREFTSTSDPMFGRGLLLLQEWSDTDLVAQAALFLFAGFDTVSTTMSFLLYDLAVNPDAQERLVQEIREHDAKNGGKIDYNIIQDMIYLDMVVSGSRFALCETKVMAYLLLREMEVYPYEKTCFPPELTKNGFTLALRGGSWVRIRGSPQK